MSLEEARTLAKLAVPVTCQLLLDKFVQARGLHILAVSWLRVSCVRAKACARR